MTPKAWMLCVTINLAAIAEASSNPVPSTNATTVAADELRFKPGPARSRLRYWRSQPAQSADIDGYPRMVAQGSTVVCFVPGYKELGFDHKAVRFVGARDTMLPLADQNGHFDYGPGVVELVEADGERALRFSVRIPPDASLGPRSIEFFGQTGNGTDVHWTMENALTVTVPMVFIVDIDGMRQDLFYEALRDDAAGCPTLRLLAGNRLSESAGDKLEHSVYEHAIALRESTTIFPTVTIVGHASIFTGSDLRQFRLGGNGFFDRTMPRKFGFCGYDTYDSAAAFRGLTLVFGLLDGLANSRVLEAPGISTVYQDAYDKYDKLESVVFHNMYYGDRARKSARWEYMSKTASAAYKPTHTTPYDDFEMFERARKDIREYEAFDYPRTGRPMGIMTLYSNGVDHLGHDGTSPTLLIDRQRKHLRETIEPGLAKFCRDVPESLFKSSHFVFIADHGQTDLNTVNQAVEPRIRSLALGRSMPKMHKLQDLLYEFGYLPDGDYTVKTTLFSQEFSISPEYCGSILGHNGGVAHVYLRRLKNVNAKPPECAGAFYSNDQLSEYRGRDRYFDAWNLPPHYSQVLDVAERFWSWSENGWAPPGNTTDEPREYRHSLEILLVRDTERARPGNDSDYWASPYLVYLGVGRTQPFDAWLRSEPGRRYLTRMGWHADERDATFLVDRVTRLNGPMSGDILVLPQYPYFYSEPDPLQGDHGSLMRDDFLVPFVVARPGGEKADVERVLDLLRKSVDLNTKSRPATTDVKKTVMALLAAQASQSTQASQAPKPLLLGRRGKDAGITLDLRWAPFQDATRRADGSTFDFRWESAPSQNGPFQKLVARRFQATSYGLQSDSSQYWSGTPEQIDWTEQVSHFENFDSATPLWFRVVYVERPGVEIASDPIGPDEIVIDLKLIGDDAKITTNVQVTEPHEIDLWPGRVDPSWAPTRSVPIGRFSLTIGSKDGTYTPFDLPFEYEWMGKTWHAWTTASRGAFDSPMSRIDVPLRPGTSDLTVRATAGGATVSRSVQVTYAPKGRTALDMSAAAERYVRRVEPELATQLADADHRDVRRFATMLRDAVGTAVRDGYGVEASYLWTRGAALYKQAYGRDLAALGTDAKLIAFGRAQPTGDQIPANVLATTMFWSGLARFQIGDFAAAAEILIRREALMAQRAAAGEEVKVPFLGFDPTASGTLPIVAQLRAWSGDVAEAVRAWSEYERQYLVANPNVTPDEMTRGAHRPPDWYTPKNRGAPALPVVDGGARATPGGMKLPGQDRPGLGLPDDPGRPTSPTTPGVTGPGTGSVVPPVVGQPLDPKALDSARELARAGKTTEALARYDAVVAAAPQDKVLRKERGTLRVWNNDLRGARDDWALVASQSPEDFDARKFAAALELAAGDARASLEQYTNLARVLPSDPLVLVGQGQAALFSGDQAAAQRAFQAALKVSPQLAASLYEQANQMLTANVPAIARIQYTTVVWLDSNAAQAYYGLGFAASKLGMKEEAIEALTRFLSTDSTSQFAANAQQELSRLRAQ